MRILVALTLVLAACGGPTKTNTPPGTTEGSDSATETCCCKSFPLTSEDGKPAYEQGGRMECSSRQGECVADVQCQTQAPTE